MKLRSLAFAAASLPLFLLSPIAAGEAGDLYFGGLGAEAIDKVTPSGARSSVIGEVTPFGLAFDRLGNLYVSDANSSTIIKIAPDGTRTTVAAVQSAHTLAFDAAGNLFVTVSGMVDAGIVKITPDGTQSVFAPGPSMPGALAFDRAGNLFKVEKPSGTILKYTPAGVETVFASGFHFPDGLAFDRAGNLFVSDLAAGAVYKISPSGARTLFASGMSAPAAIAFDHAGALIVGDAYENTIYRFDASGARAVLVAGVGTALAVEPATSVPLNISTRASVQNEQSVLIAGFVIAGAEPKNVLIRGLGPSLGIGGTLADPVVRLFDSGGAEIAANDNWRDAQQQVIESTGMAPLRDQEAAIAVRLEPGSYTVMTAGQAGSIGIGLIEIYDLDRGVGSHLANISSRGLVEREAEVMIGGFIIGAGNGSGTVILRALGRSLYAAGVGQPIGDPAMSLHDANGATIAANDNWRDSQASEIELSGFAPADELEAAIVATLPSGAYTAVVQRHGGSPGVGLFEVYSAR